MGEQPRGVRNNNPGNLRWGDPWQGLVPEAQRTDKDFCQFVAPAWGIRAIAVTLITYQDKHALNTVAGIIGRWSPPSENDTAAYVRAVAWACGVAAETPINVHDYTVMAPLVRAIIRHENGRGRFTDGDWYDKTTLDEGLRLAGVVLLAPRVLPTPVGVAALAGGTAAAVEAMNQVQPVLQATAQVVNATAGWPQWLRLLGTTLVLVSLSAAGWAWWRQRRAMRAVHAP